MSRRPFWEVLRSKICIPLTRYIYVFWTPSSPQHESGCVTAQDKFSSGVCDLICYDSTNILSLRIRNIMYLRAALTATQSASLKGESQPSGGADIQHLFGAIVIYVRVVYFYIHEHARQLSFSINHKPNSFPAIQRSSTFSLPQRSRYSA